MLVNNAALQVPDIITPQSPIFPSQADFGPLNLDMSFTLGMLNGPEVSDLLQHDLDQLF